MGDLWSRQCFESLKRFGGVCWSLWGGGCSIVRTFDIVVSTIMCAIMSDCSGWLRLNGAMMQGSWLGPLSFLVASSLRHSYNTHLAFISFYLLLGILQLQLD